MKSGSSLSKWIILLFLVLLFTGFELQADEQEATRSNNLASQGNPADASGWIRVIIEFLDEPVVRLPGLPRNNKGKISINNPSAIAHRFMLENSHTAFRENLSFILPQAKIIWDYYTVFNGVSIRLLKVDLDKLENLQNIKAVHQDKSYELDMDVGADMVGATALYPALGGVDHAGENIKVAVVDTGIYMNHDFFDPTNFSMPLGYPRGETNLCTNKVIVARTYFRPSDPVNTSQDFADARDGYGHGTHCSGTIAGVPTQITYLGNILSIQGVAPKAHLMAYKIFYYALSGSVNAYAAEIMAAMDAVVEDDADVMSNSWGGASGTSFEHEPTSTAFNNIVFAGVIVVKSAGNSRASMGEMSAGEPDPLITVAASTSSRMFGRILDVTEPAGSIPSNLTNILYRLSAVGASFSSDIGPAKVVEANLDGTEINPGDLTGNIALILRGTFSFEVKVTNAETDGAIAAIIYNNIDDSLVYMNGAQQGIPAVFIGKTNGEDLLQWVNNNSAANRIVIFAGSKPVARIPWALASFSSIGPNNNFTIKPDITAPGYDTLSSRHTGTDNFTNEYSLMSGTSMACPHIAGVCALLKQAHPGWSTWQAKSALMTTAGNNVLEPDETTPATVMTCGSGSVRADIAADPGFVTHTPSVSFGLVKPGENFSKSITLHSVINSSEKYAISINETNSDVNLIFSLNKSSVTVADNGAQTFVFSIEAGMLTAPGDYEGEISLIGDNGHDGKIIYWVRIIPDLASELILLVDADNSPAFNDVQAYYTNALDAIGMSMNYVVWDMDITGSFPAFLDLIKYKAVIVFSSDDDSNYFLNVNDRSQVVQYLWAGGRLAMLGAVTPWEVGAHDGLLAMFSELDDETDFIGSNSVY